MNPAQTAHAASCASCGALTRQMADLDKAFAGHLDVHVPEGFADRVMARLPPASAAREARRGLTARLNGLLERRSVQIALAHAGAAVTIANLIRFVFSLLVPATSLGAGR